MYTYHEECWVGDPSGGGYDLTTPSVDGLTSDHSIEDLELDIADSCVCVCGWGACVSVCVCVCVSDKMWCNSIV